MYELKEQLTTETKNITKEVKEKIVTMILTGFGLVAALAWNEAIKGLFDAFFPAQASGLIAKFVYAFIITVVVVFISVQLNKISKKSE